MWEKTMRDEPLLFFFPFLSRTSCLQKPILFFRFKVQLKKERSLQSINRQLRRKNEKNSWHGKKGQQRKEDKWVKKILKVIDLQNESRLKFVMIFSLCVCVSLVLTSWSKCSFSSLSCLEHTTWGFDHKEDTHRTAFQTQLSETWKKVK